MRYLIILLALFFAPFSYSQIFTYYQPTGGGTFNGQSCSTEKNDICNAGIAYNNNGSGDSVYSLTSCFVSNGTLKLTGVVTSKSQPDRTPGNFTQGVGLEKFKECPEGEALKLNGCTATCVPDPCKSTGGQTRMVTVSCGMYTCPSGSVIEHSSGVSTCTNGQPGSFIPKPSQSASSDGCLFNLMSDYEPAWPDPLVSIESSGSSVQAYCTVSMVGAGVSTSESETLPSDLSLARFKDVIPTTENGQCPDNTTKGQINDQWVCVPNSGTGENGSQCPTGQTKVDGVCKPTSNTGDNGTGENGTGENGTQCPAGQTKVDGVCKPTSNTGGGGGGGGADDGSYTGSNKCEAAPQCSGDVVQCGLMAEQHKAKCESLSALTGLPEGMSEQLEKIGTASNDSRIGAAKGQATSAIDSVAQKIGFSNSACLSDIVISVKSIHITLPLSSACDLFKLFRLFLHLAAYFFCLRMFWSILVTV